MALVTVKEILELVTPGWAVGAFNVHNMDDVQAVVRAAEELRAPVILMGSQSGLKYSGVSYLAAICRTAAESASVPVALQLDHGQTFELVLQCIRYGFTSVMFDGSQLPYDENVAETRRVVEVARAFGVSVEGELGLLGGKEDDIIVDEDDARLTDPDEAVRFVEATGIDVFAPAVGTAHGFYQGEPEIDFARLTEISSRLSVPVALHGSSGLSDEVIGKAIECGAKKINVGTDLKWAYTHSLREFLVNNPTEHEPRKVFADARAKMTEMVKDKIRLFKSDGRVN